MQEAKKRIFVLPGNVRVGQGQSDEPFICPLNGGLLKDLGYLLVKATELSIYRRDNHVDVTESEYQVPDCNTSTSI